MEKSRKGTKAHKTQLSQHRSADAVFQPGSKFHWSDDV
jgi:hypothetical protein